MKFLGKLAILGSLFGNTSADEIYATNYGDVSREGKNVKYVYQISA